MIHRANIVSTEHATKLALGLTELQCVLLITVAEAGSITIKRTSAIEGDSFELFDAAIALAWSRPICEGVARAAMINMCPTGDGRSSMLSIEHLGRDVAVECVRRLTT